MKLKLLFAITLLIPSLAESQTLPCIPNSGYWSVTNNEAVLNVCTADGLKYVSTSSTTVRLLADQVNAAASFANLNISWPVLANTRYQFECTLFYNVNATTNGTGITYNGPAAPITAIGNWTSVSSAGALLSNIMTSYNTSTPLFTPSTNLLNGNIGTFKGIFSNGVNAGTLQMRFRPEVAVANALTVRANSFCTYNTF